MSQATSMADGPEGVGQRAALSGALRIVAAATELSARLRSLLTVIFGRSP